MGEHNTSPVHLLHIFRTPFPKNTYGGLLLSLLDGISLLGKLTVPMQFSVLTKTRNNPQRHIVIQ